MADEPAEIDVGRALVDEFLSDVNTLSSHFDQSLMDANGDIVEVSSGTLEINRPDQFR